MITELELVNERELYVEKSDFWAVEMPTFTDALSR